MYENIPAELRALPQWVAVDMSINPETGEPLKEPLNPRFTKTPAKTNDPSTWGTFEQAVAHGSPIGFVLSKNDPYAIIDLDNKPHKPASPEALVVHNQILTGVESYIERSISGTGYHIVVRGSIPTGVNFGNIELYSDGRMMIFTGDVVKNLPIDDYDEAINNMYEQMQARREQTRPAVELEQVDGHMEDGDIFVMASDAANGHNFNKLCRGEWHDFGFPSQSEADLALMSMFAFYSKDNEQCRRMFRMTALGKRDKHQESNNHLDRMLAIARSKDPGPVNETAVQEKVAAVMAEINTPAVPIVATESFAPKLPEGMIKSSEIGYLTPPGILSTMADYIYATMPRQVREYAVCASIAMFAGIISRSYNVSRTGLNLYLIVLGHSGVGKEGMVQGIDRLENAMNDGLTEPKSVNLGDFSSIQGLQKALTTQPCGLKVIGEVGLELKKMLNDKAVDSQAVNLKKAYLDIFNKSGKTDSMVKVTYAKDENKLERIQSPNLSILGESVPHRFYETINEVTAEDGFVSRLMIVEYSGHRNDHNSNDVEPPIGLINTLTAIRDYCTDMQAKQEVLDIPIEPAAKKVLDQYDKDITKQMNKANDCGQFAISALLNRSHLKAWRLAGLGAVADKHYTPVITLPLVKWAIEFVNRADAIVISRFESGEIGAVGETQFEKIIKDYIIAYLKMNPKQRMDYNTPEALSVGSNVSHSYLWARCKSNKAFAEHSNGPQKAFDSAIKLLTEIDVLIEIHPTQAIKSKNGRVLKAYMLGEMFKV